MMKWVSKIRDLQKGFRQKLDVESIETKPELRLKSKERIAGLWFGFSFLVAMLLVTHIYELPFMIFDPDFGKSIQKNESMVTDSQKNADFQVDANFSSAPELSEMLAPVIMKTTLKETLGLQSSSSDGAFSMISRLKYFFLCGLIAGGVSLGPMAELFGRKRTFKILSRTLIIFIFLMSISRHFYTAGTCWFFIGFTLVSNYHMLHVNAVEKFSDLYESPHDLHSEDTLSARYKKYKYRLYIILGFGFTWNFSRLLTLLVSWLTKDWTLILMWLGIIFSFLYFTVGDFMEKFFEDEDVLKQEIDESDEDCQGENFYTALREHPILGLNVFILAFNWFVVCHNLFALVLGWARISRNSTMFENIAVATGMSFLAQPIKYGVCLVTRRKVLPYSLTQFFSGVIILTMIAFDDKPSPFGKSGSTELASGKIFAAHVASVLLSVSIGIIEPLTYENIPKKYRLYGSGLCSAAGRLGLLVGSTLNQLGYFKTSFGPAFGGTLSIVAAIMSRILPDLTTSRMPKTQLEIERQQFPHRTEHQQQPVSANGDLTATIATKPLDCTE